MTRTLFGAKDAAAWLRSRGVGAIDGVDITPEMLDRARERAIVIHGAAYVTPNWVTKHGRLGRSLGCPAVRPEVARMVVDQLKGGQFLFAWHNDPRWQQHSAYLQCEPQRVAMLGRDGEG